MFVIFNTVVVGFIAISSKIPLNRRSSSFLVMNKLQNKLANFEERMTLDQNWHRRADSKPTISPGRTRNAGPFGQSQGGIRDERFQNSAAFAVVFPCQMTRKTPN